MSDLHQVTQNSIDHLTSLGISAPQAREDATVPYNYSEIPDMGQGNIGDVMGRLASYIEYLEYQVSIAESDFDVTEQGFEFTKKRKLLLATTQRRDLMEAEIDSDSEVAIMKGIVMQKSSHLILLKSILEGKKRVFDSLSRELSRRNLIMQQRRVGL